MAEFTYPIGFRPTWASKENLELEPREHAHQSTHLKILQPIPIVLWHV